METNFSKIPVIRRTPISKPEVYVSSSCCTPKKTEEACCTPSTSKDENEGACCAQPEDGSACCDK